MTKLLKMPLVALMITLSLVGLSGGHTSEGKNSSQVLHVTDYEGMNVVTENENILLFTKKNPFELKKEEKLNVSLTLRSKIAKDAGVVLVVYGKVDGKLDYVDEFHLKGFSLKEYEGNGKIARSFPFAISSKYFATSFLRIGAIDIDFELHLHKNEKLEPGGKGRLIDIPTIKPDGVKTPSKR